MIEVAPAVGAGLTPIATDTGCIPAARQVRSECLNQSGRHDRRSTFEPILCDRSGGPASAAELIGAQRVCGEPSRTGDGRGASIGRRQGFAASAFGEDSAAFGRFPQQAARDQAAGHDGRGRNLSEPMNQHSDDDEDRTSSHSQNSHVGAGGDGSKPETGPAAGDGGPGDPPDAESYPLRKNRSGDGALEAADDESSSSSVDGVVPRAWYEDQLKQNAVLHEQTKELEEEVQRLREENERLDATAGQQPTGYEPFPIESLPPVPQAYVQAASEALDVHPAFVAVPLLSVLSSGVGAAARLQLKRSWKEPATLWTALVAPSGSTKSPALRHALRPVYRHEREALETYEAAMDRYDPDSDEKQPVRTRYRTGDPTPEAVVRILQDNPRGLLLSRDELAAWIGSFDRYSSGAADLQFWIELWNGVQVSRDRVGDGNVTVSNPAVPLTGTIQPETLKEKIGELHFQSGFASRLILCRPPVKPKTWTEADVTQDLEDRYGRLLRTLYALEEKMDLGEPFHVDLSSGAKELWVDFFDDVNETVHREDRSTARAARAKSINHAARFALIFHLSEVAEGDREAGDVNLSTMLAGVKVARWCLRETLRVYRSLDLGMAALEPREQMLEMLGDTFGTSDAHSFAPKFDVTERTIRNWIGELLQEGKVEKLHKGFYRKKDV